MIYSICSKCGKVRIKEGNDIPSIKDSDIFSHGMCTDCMRVFYADDALEEDLNNLINEELNRLRREKEIWVVPKEIELNIDGSKIDKR